MWPFKKKTLTESETKTEEPKLLSKEKPKEVFIQTGSHRGFDGLSPVAIPGWPLTKTNVARKPGHNEIECNSCDGDGWDANSGGGVFICPDCHGTGVMDGTAVCECGHNKTKHYLGRYDCKGNKSEFDQKGCWCAQFRNEQEPYHGTGSLIQDGWKKDENGRWIRIEDTPEWKYWHQVLKKKGG